MKGKTTAKETNVTYEAEVTRAKEIKDGTVAFDMKVNGVTIYGCFYREYTSKEGKEGTMISLPSQKSEKDGKYYNHVFFPISKEMKDNIIAQLEKLV